MQRQGIVKPEAATAVIELLIMGRKTPETCWAVNKRQDNKLENCCIWLVIYLNWNVYIYMFVLLKCRTRNAGVHIHTVSVLQHEMCVDRSLRLCKTAVARNKYCHTCPWFEFNPLNAELNPICCLLAWLGAHHFLHVTRIRVKSLTLRLLMSCIYIYIWSTHSWCF